MGVAPEVREPFQEATVHNALTKSFQDRRQSGQRIHEPTSGRSIIQNRSYTQTHLSVCTYRHMCLCVHTDTCVCVYTQTHVSVFTHRHTGLCVHTQTHLSVCTHRCMCLCTHRHMWLCVHTETCFSSRVVFLTRLLI